METAGVPDLTNEEKALRNDFLSLYLRHPQWIMSSRNFFRTKQEEEATKAGRAWKVLALGKRLSVWSGFWGLSVWSGFWN